MAITLNFSTGEIGWASGAGSSPGGTWNFVDGSSVEFIDGSVGDFVV